MTTDPERDLGDERHRLADTVHVLHGPAGTGSLRTVLYAAYVTLILALTYGFTVARGVFVSSDPAWVRAHLLQPVTLVVVAPLLLVGGGLAFRIGRLRGPVVPPLPWTDLVVLTSIDRTLTLRQWWASSHALLASGAVIVLGVIGGGLWASGATGPLGLIGGALVGLLTGSALATAWFAGQVAASGSPAPLPWRRDRALRHLRGEQLRQHGTRATRLGGAVLAGDLRAARLEMAAPVTRGRSLRLSPGGRYGTVVRRDLLGLRRRPGSFGAGLLLTALGCAGIAWSLADPAVPPFLTCLCTLACQLGVGQWSEGLRLHADGLGAPSLSGLAPGREALAHTVAPLLLLAATWVAAATLVWGALRPYDLLTSVATGAGWLVVLVVAFGATQWLVAFRGRPPVGAFLPETGPSAMLAWQLRPNVAAVALGALPALAARMPLTPLLLGVVVLVVLGLWARACYRTVWSDHRD